MGTSGKGGSMGYRWNGARTGTLTPFQVPQSLTSAAGPFPPLTDPGPMALVVVLWFVALSAATVAVGRALAPPSVRHLGHSHSR